MNASERDRSGEEGATLNEDFRASLARLLSEERRCRVRGMLSIILCAALSVFSALLAFDFHFGQSRFFPLISFVLFWATVAAAASFAVLRQMLPIRGARELAGELDGHLGGNLLTAALEFSKGDGRLDSYSPYLLAATVSRANGRLRAFDARELFSAAGKPAWTAAGILIGVLVALQVTFLRGDPGAIVASIADPGRSFRFPYQYNLVVTSGDRSVLPGEHVTAEALNFGSMRGDATLWVSAIPGVWNRIDVPGTPLDDAGMELSVYRHTFNDVREDFSYFFSAGGARTPHYEVTVIHRPVINNLSAVLKFPRYTGARPDTLDPLAGKIAALSGTRVELRGETSKPVRDGWIRFTSGATASLEPAAGGFAGFFTVLASDTFVVEIVDSLGFANEQSVKYPVAALEDRAPSVEILGPEDGAQLPRTLVADLAYRASDDYGIARITLQFMREGKDEQFKPRPLDLSSAGPLTELEGRTGALPPEPQGRTAAMPLTELEGRTAWSLEDENVFPGDEILYYLEVFDNNTATGPSSARTETRRLVVPSLSEIYARIHEEESQQRENLEDVLDKGREIHERLKKLSDELKAEGNLDWSRRRESGDILEKQRELKERMREITNQIDQSLEQIEKNRSSSQEVGQKIEEIQKLLKQIESEDLRKAIENLQKLMSEIPTKELMSAMNQAELDTEKLLENMDRTIELLKQVIKEEKMEELVRRMDDMLKEQTAIRDSTPRGPTDELSKKQDELGTESEKYEKELGEFADEETDSSLASELDRARERMEQAKLDEQMSRAADQLSNGDRNGAQCTQKSVINDMLSLFTSLSSCQMSMGGAMEKEVAEMLERSARELVETSKLQERMAPKLLQPGARANSDELVKDELVVKTAVQKITQNLHQAARKALSLSPKILVMLGAAQREIETALDAMEEQKLNEAAEASAKAYRDINIAVIELLRTSVSSGSSGSGSSARQMMQQLMQRQLSLQQQLRQLLERGQAGQWSMEERAGMARLAAEQRKMEELVKQIAEEAGGTNELMGKLDDLSGKMEEIAKDLEDGKLDNELVERQEQILTRMLDSQRSMRERDYKKERTSATAADVKALAPSVWEEGINDTETLLKMIRRAMREKGPAEYEELIRQYFRALSEKARETR
jgi:hypothetical protein